MFDINHDDQFISFATQENNITRQMISFIVVICDTDFPILILRVLVGIIPLQIDNHDVHRALFMVGLGLMLPKTEAHYSNSST